MVAAVEGGSAQQSWVNVARALSAALRVVEDGGAVVVCTELGVPPGPALIRFLDESSETAGQLSEHDDAQDAMAAAQLGDALKRVRVYLLSHLEAELLERWALPPSNYRGKSAICASVTGRAF